MEDNKTICDETTVKDINSEFAHKVMINGKYAMVDGKEVEESIVKEIKPTYLNKKDIEWVKKGFNINEDDLKSDYFDEISYRKNLMWIDNMKTAVLSEVTSIFTNFEWLCKYLKGCNLPQPSLCNYKQYHMMATIMLPNDTMTLQAIPETRDIVDKNDGVGKKELFRYRWEISTNCQFRLTHVTDDNTLIKLYNMWDVKFTIILTLSKLLKSDIFKTIQEEAFNGQLVN